MDVAALSGITKVNNTVPMVVVTTNIGTRLPGRLFNAGYEIFQEPTLSSHHVPHLTPLSLRGYLSHRI